MGVAQSWLVRTAISLSEVVVVSPCYPVDGEVGESGLASFIQRFFHEGEKSISTSGRHGLSRRRRSAG